MQVTLTPIEDEVVSVTLTPVEDEPATSWGEIATKAGKTVFPAFGEGVGGLIRAAEDVIPDSMKARDFNSLGKQTADYWRKKIEENQPAVVPGSIREYASKVLQNVAQNVPTLAVGAATGGAAVPLTVMGLQAGGQKYSQMREAGKSPAVSGAGATLIGASEAATELLPFAELIKPGVRFAKRLVMSAAFDVPGELINTTIESAVDKITITPDMSWEDYGKALADTAVISLASAGLLTAVAHPIVRAREKAETAPAPHSQGGSPVAVTLTPVEDILAQGEANKREYVEKVKGVEVLTPKVNETPQSPQSPVDVYRSVASEEKTFDDFVDNLVRHGEYPQAVKQFGDVTRLEDFYNAVKKPKPHPLPSPPLEREGTANNAPQPPLNLRGGVEATPVTLPFKDEIKANFPEFTDEDLSHIAKETAAQFDYIANTAKDPAKKGGARASADAWTRFAESGEVPLAKKGKNQGKPLASFEFGRDEFDTQLRNYMDRKANYKPTGEVKKFGDLDMHPGDTVVTPNDTYVLQKDGETLQDSIPMKMEPWDDIEVVDVKKATDKTGIDSAAHEAATSPLNDLPEPKKSRTSEEAQRDIDNYEALLAKKYRWDEVAKAPIYPELYTGLDIPKSKLADAEIVELQRLYSIRDKIDTTDLNDWRDTIIRDSELPAEEVAGGLQALGFAENGAQVYFAADNLKNWGKDTTANLGRLYNHFAHSDTPYESTHAKFSIGGTPDNIQLTGKVFDEDLRQAEWDKEALRKTESLFNAITKTQGNEPISLKNITRSQTSPKDQEMFAGVNKVPVAGLKTEKAQAEDMLEGFRRQEETQKFIDDAPSQKAIEKNIEAFTKGTWVKRVSGEGVSSNYLLTKDNKVIRISDHTPAGLGGQQADIQIYIGGYYDGEPHEWIVRYYKKESKPYDDPIVIPFQTRQELVEALSLAEAESEKKAILTNHYIQRFLRQNGESEIIKAAELQNVAPIRLDKSSELSSGVNRGSEPTTVQDGLTKRSDKENIANFKKDVKAFEKLANIIKEIERIASPGTRVEAKDRITLDPEQRRVALQKWGEGADSDVKIGGAHRVVYLNSEGFRSLIELSLENMDPKTTPYHEAFHSVQEFLLTDENIGRLEERFPDRDGVSSSERQADAFADYVAGRQARYPVWVREIFARIKNFLNSIRSYLKGQGFASVNDIFEKAYSGELRERPTGIRGAGEMSFDINSSDFRKWFGDSKVVDADGKPLVVYHGTDQDVSVFAADKLGFNTNARSAKGGYFFTDNARAAGLYPVYDEEVILGWGGMIPKRPKRYFEGTEAHRKLIDIQNRLSVAIKERDATIEGEKPLSKERDTRREKLQEQLISPLLEEEKIASKYLHETPEYKQYSEELKKNRLVAEEGNVLARSQKAVEQLRSKIMTIQNMITQNSINEEAAYPIIIYLRDVVPNHISDHLRVPKSSERKYIDKKYNLDQDSEDYIHREQKALDAEKSLAKEILKGKSDFIDSANDAIAEAGKTRQALDEAHDWDYNYRFSQQAWAGGDASSGEVWEAKKERTTANILPMYLSIQNPLIHIQETVYRDVTFAELIDSAKKEGHDGLIVRNTKDPLPMDVYVAFSPTQIKSVFNRGTFDPNNPNISLDIEQRTVKATDNLLQKINPQAAENVKVQGRKKDLGFVKGLIGSPRTIEGLAHYYVVHGKNAVHIQDRLRGMIDEKMGEIFRPLKTKELRAEFEALSWMGDAEEKNYTTTDMDEMGVSSTVKDAYLKHRKFHEQVWRLLSSHRKAYGGETGHREGHIPHLFENWNVYEMKEEDGKEVSAGIAGTFRSLKEATLFANTLSRDKNYLIRPKTFQMPDALIAKTVMKDASYFKLVEKMEKGFEMTRDEAFEMVNEVARRKNRRRTFGNIMKRTGQTGFRKDDLHQILTEYYNSSARYVALDNFKAKVVPQFEKDFGVELGRATSALRDKNTARYVEEYINDVNGVPGMIEELLDASIKNAFGTHIRSERPAIWTVNKALHTTAVLKLGLLNLSAGVVNLSQLINTFSKVPVKHFAGAFESAFHLDESERAILRRIGVDFDLGLTDTGGYSVSHKGGKIVKASMFFFQAAELHNRRITALAAYRHARKDLGMGERSARHYARELVDKTQFDYSVADTARIFRNPAGRLLGQFKPYAIKEIEFIIGLKGAENIKFWIPLLLTGGTAVVPMIEGLSGLIEWLTGKNPLIEAKKFFMEWAGDDKEKKRAAEIAMYGIGSQLGIDISRRVGTGDVLPKRATDLLGPTLNTLLNAKKILSADKTELVRSLAPSVGNLVTAIETVMNDMDVTDPYHRERLKYTATPSEVAIKGLGFRPLKESKLSDIEQIRQYETEHYNKGQQAYVDQAIGAINGGDAEEFARIITRAAEEGVIVDSKAIENEMEQKLVPQELRTLLKTRNMLKGGQLERMEFLNE